MKKILFISALDFKEKSIQVIRKTPEAYVDADWHVDYVVARDNLKNGNYYYEDEINPHGMTVHRIYWPLSKFRWIYGRYVSLLFSKLASFIVVIKLFSITLKLLKINKYDVVYGYELQGVLAMNLLKPFLNSKVKLISRFQGTFLNEMFLKKQYLRLFFNFDLILAIRLNSDLLIMTNDGTQGNKAVEKIKGKKKYKMVFWQNGVDLLKPTVDFKTNKLTETTTFMSISRLVHWKKVERCIEVVRALRDAGFSDFVYYVIGEGDRRSNLELMVKNYSLNDHVIFLGALKHNEAMKYLNNADYFLSMYDSSNVGNPLFEAIRAKKIIVTLANGDTAEWIEHKVNGLIYDPNNLNFEAVARDIIETSCNKSINDGLIEQIEITEKNKLRTWHERLSMEVMTVGGL